MRLMPLARVDEAIELRRSSAVAANSADVARFTVNVVNLAMDVDFEPLFATAALYDVTTRRRVSEQVHFDTNNEHMRHLLRSHQNAASIDVSSQCKQAVFSVTNMSATISSWPVSRA